MTRLSPRRLTLAALFGLALPAMAAPSYYGFGFPHIIALEHNPALYTSQYALAAYDTPVRAKSNGEFLSRFIWQDMSFANVISGGLAAGNFWPANDTREYLMMFRRYGQALSGEVYQAPGVYSQRGWDLQSSWLFGTAPAGGSNDIVCVTAGDVLSSYSGDELIVVQSLSDSYRSAPRHQLLVYSRPSATNQNNWILRGTSATLPEPGMEVIGMAAGDFAWAGRAWLAIMYRSGAGKIVRYYDLAGFPAFTAKGQDATPFDTLAEFSLACGDYTKEYGREGQK